MCLARAALPFHAHGGCGLGCRGCGERGSWWKRAEEASCSSVQGLLGCVQGCSPRRKDLLRTAWPAAGSQPPSGCVHRNLRTPLSLQPLLPKLPLPWKALPLAQPLHPEAQQHRLSLTHQRGPGGLPGVRAEAGDRCVRGGRRGLHGSAPAPGPAQGACAPVPRAVPETRLFGFPGLRPALPKVSRCVPRQGAAPGGCQPAAITTEAPESSQLFPDQDGRAHGKRGLSDGLGGPGPRSTR